MAERYPPTYILPVDLPFAPDMSPQERVPTHYTRAENIIHEQDGSIRKFGGSARINSTAIDSGANITGMFDAWFAGASGTFTQKFMAFSAGQKILKEDMDGTFDDITGGATLTANATPVFEMFGDLVLITDSAADTPLKWSGSGNVASLGGSPNAGRIVLKHNNRAWMISPKANPSTAYYSAYGDPETWSGIDTGSLTFDDDDGDIITGAASYQDRLIIFKGPNKGSIHIVDGKTPADYVATKRISGIALQSPDAIVPVGDDLWFMSRRGIHSWKTVNREGNSAEADLSRFQRSFFTSTVKSTQLSRVWGVNYAEKSCVLWCLTRATKTDPDVVFGISYINPERGLKPFILLGRSCFSAATRLHPTTSREEIVFGTTDGFCERQDTTDRSLANGSAYTMHIEYPFLLLAPPQPRGDQPVMLKKMYLKSKPVGAWDVKSTVLRDSAGSASYAFDQGVAGFILDVDNLDETLLGGGNAQTTVVNLSGEATATQVSFTQAGYNQDAQLYEAGIDYDLSRTTTEAR